MVSNKVRTLKTIGETLRIQLKAEAFVYKQLKYICNKTKIRLQSLTAKKSKTPKKQKSKSLAISQLM